MPQSSQNMPAITRTQLRTKPLPKLPGFAHFCDRFGGGRTQQILEGVICTIAPFLDGKRVIEQIGNNKLLRLQSNLQASGTLIDSSFNVVMMSVLAINHLDRFLSSKDQSTHSSSTEQSGLELRSQLYDIFEFITGWAQNVQDILHEIASAHTNLYKILQTEDDHEAHITQTSGLDLRPLPTEHIENGEISKYVKPGITTNQLQNVLNANPFLKTIDHTLSMPGALLKDIDELKDWWDALHDELARLAKGCKTYSKITQLRPSLRNIQFYISPYVLQRTTLLPVPQWTTMLETTSSSIIFTRANIPEINCGHILTARIEDIREFEENVFGMMLRVRAELVEKQSDEGGVADDVEEADKKQTTYFCEAVDIDWAFEQGGEKTHDPFVAGFAPCGRDSDVTIQPADATILDVTTQSHRLTSGREWTFTKKKGLRRRSLSCDIGVVLHIHESTAHITSMNVAVMVKYLALSDRPHEQMERVAVQKLRLVCRRLASLVEHIALSTLTLHVAFRSHVSQPFPVQKFRAYSTRGGTRALNHVRHLKIKNLCVNFGANVSSFDAYLQPPIVSRGSKHDKKTTYNRRRHFYHQLLKNLLLLGDGLKGVEFKTISWDLNCCMIHGDSPSEQWECQSTISKIARWLNQRQKTPLQRLELRVSDDSIPDIMDYLFHRTLPCKELVVRKDFCSDYLPTDWLKELMDNTPALERVNIDHMFDSPATLDLFFPRLPCPSRMINFTHLNISFSDLPPGSISPHIFKHLRFLRTLEIHSCGETDDPSSLFQQLISHSIFVDDLRIFSWDVPNGLVDYLASYPKPTLRSFAMDLDVDIFSTPSVDLALDFFVRGLGSVASGLEDLELPSYSQKPYCFGNLPEAIPVFQKCHALRTLRMSLDGVQLRHNIARIEPLIARTFKGHPFLESIMIQIVYPHFSDLFSISLRSQNCVKKMLTGLRPACMDFGAFRTAALDPLQRSAEVARIPDYKHVANGIETMLRAYHMNQPGDPQKGARIVVDVVRGEGSALGKTFPTSLCIGSDCYGPAKAAAEQIVEKMEEWKAVTFSTDFDKIHSRL
ncbi:hypothetical protein CVT24_000701 [Panaeolus cyanescens]|uniref:Uncharacterized protein n=1 Tax=Panaeolus cyanescens TaxID=181874 RepID=A0A409WBG0_9AGAR|nr:hypothetical protein CVT24_000701 [Panaeolus cyanescens]